MSLIRVRDGLSPMEAAAVRAGGNIVKYAGTGMVSYGLSGALYLSQSGYLLLSVPNALVRGVFQALDEHGVELPPSEHGSGFNAHVTVMSPEEVEKVGGGEKITERGKHFRYSLGRLREVEPDNWPGMSRVWYVDVHSPDIQALRRSYGLTSLPHGGDYEFHITVAVRRRGVLGGDAAKV